MYADKTSRPGPRPPAQKRRPSDFRKSVLVVRLFGSSNGRAFRATTPDLMNSRIRLRSEVAATLRPLSAVVHHNHSIWRQRQSMKSILSRRVHLTSMTWHTDLKGGRPNHFSHTTSN
jgi:hypothetical protein